MTFRFIILAAGKGTRMGASVPKALVPIAGKPILEHLYESVRASEVDGDPIVVIGHEGDQLCSSFKGSCEYVIQEEQLGTGHAVQVCQQAVQDADAIIVLYGDHPFVSAEALRELATLHESSSGVLTMMTTTVPSFDDWPSYQHWGRVLRSSNGAIEAIREYKDATEQERSITELNPGLYCFDTTWLWANIDQIQNANASGEYYLTDLVELAVNQGHAIATSDVAPEQSIGVNTPAELALAEEIYHRLHGAS